MINKKRNSGITLIALVITIIVLLILAGVTVATLTGDNGLLNKAGEAKNASEQANLEEEVKLALIEGQTDKYFNSNSNMEEKLKAIFEKSYGQGNIDVTKAGKNYKVKVKNTKTAYRIKPDGTVEKYEEMDPTPVYARLDDDGILYLRATQLQGYNLYTNSNSIKTNWNKENNANQGSVTKVIIEQPIAPQNVTTWFMGCYNLTEIELEKLYTNNVTSFDAMFSGCNKLTKINLDKFDTSNANSMKNMFYGCGLVKELNIIGFDTKNTTDLQGMFSGCSGLLDLDVTGLDTSNVVNLGGIFGGCSKLEYLDISKFDTNKVNNMSTMFLGCSNLKKLDLENFDTKNVRNFDAMFSGCINLKEINLNNFNTINATVTKNMFYHCINLNELDLENFNTKKVTNFTGMFDSVVASIKLGENWNELITSSNTGYVGTHWNI